MRARRLAALLLLVAGAAPGCGGASPPKAASPPPVARPAVAPGASPQADRAGALSALLRAVARPGPVLDALPASAQKALRARLASLDAQRKLDAVSEDGPLAESMPLLHLLSGGNSPRALYALATTPAGATELSGLLADDARAAVPEAAQVALVAELARRAALNFLRDRAADVPGPKPSALVYRLIERAALAVDRRDIERAALEALLELDASPENKLELSRTRARELDVSGARALLEAASADAKRAPNPLAVSRAAQAVERAALLTAPDTGASTLARARALLHLGRLKELRELLAEHEADTRTDLGLAGARAAALLGGSCPGLPPGVATSALCARAFHESADVKAALSLLESGWHSGRGRDQEALEYYFAIARIVPWMQRAAGANEPGAVNRYDAPADAKALLAELDAASANAPSLQGLALFVAAMGGALDLSQTANDDALLAKARALAKTGGHFNQPGALAVAALLARRRDVAPILDALPAASEPSPARAALDAWVAVTQGKKERMGAARNELAEVMTGGGGASLERVRLVLSMAEGDAVLDGSERSYQLLSRVAGQLLSESIPPDLAFRTVLDTAGALSRGGRRERALQIVHEAGGAQVPSARESFYDMWRLVRGYDLVLGKATSAAELGLIAQQLSQLAAAPIAPSVQLWLELWSHELGARSIEAACPRGGATCAARARALRRVARDSIVARVGREAAPLIERGFLPGGSVNLACNFSPESGLEPTVSFDPAFLAVELPKLELY